MNFSAIRFVETVKGPPLSSPDSTAMSASANSKAYLYGVLPASVKKLVSYLAGVRTTAGEAVSARGFGCGVRPSAVSRCQGLAQSR